MADSLDRIIGIVDIFDENLDYFDDEELAFKRYKELVREQPIDENQEWRRAKFLKQLETSSITKEGIKKAVTPFVEARKEFIEAKETKDIEEQIVQYEEAYDVAGELPKGKARLKLRQQSGRGIFETKAKTRRADRGLGAETSDEVVLYNYRKVGPWMEFWDIPASRYDEAIDSLDRWGYYVDESGNLIKQ